MKRNIHISALAVVLLIGLTACSGSQDESGQPSNEGKEKTNTEEIDNGATEQSGAFPHATKRIAQSHGEKVTWWVFKDANWSKDFKGLKMKIEQVAITKEIPNIELGKRTPAVRVKFKVHNTSSKYKFEIHPAYAILRTSTGKRVKAAMFISEEVEGKIDHGETEEATAGFYIIKNPKVDQIKSISLDFAVKRTQQNEKGEKEKDFSTGEIKLG